VPPRAKKYSAEAVENELNIFIEKRAKQARDANWAARQWAESLSSYNLSQASERRREWLLFHRRLQVLHTQLADEHKSKADALIEANGGSVAWKEKPR
jgi:hypothetical protein